MISFLNALALSHGYLDLELNFIVCIVFITCFLSVMKINLLQLCTQLYILIQRNLKINQISEYFDRSMIR